MIEFHQSVLLDEAITFLNVMPGKKYVDATLGGGGHTRSIVSHGGAVLALDVDKEAIHRFVIEQAKDKVRIVQGNFKDIQNIAETNGFEKVDGVLFDLGVSSHHFQSAARGFSFMREGPLDMRMDDALSVTAADLVNGLTKKELALLFEKYGEEPRALKVAGAIVDWRTLKKIESTSELARIVERNLGRNGKIHPATRVFQALRIAVNDELHVLEEGMSGAFSLLQNRGRVVVISFHSLEDRIVKHTFQTWESEGKGQVLTKKPLVPNDDEIAKNPRSRSAKLRVFEKI